MPPQDSAISNCEDTIKALQHDEDLLIPLVLGETAENLGLLAAVYFAAYKFAGAAEGVIVGETKVVLETAQMSNWFNCYRSLWAGRGALITNLGTIAANIIAIVQGFKDESNAATPKDASTQADILGSLIGNLLSFLTVAGVTAGEFVKQLGGSGLAKFGPGGITNGVPLLNSIINWRGTLSTLAFAETRTLIKLVESDEHTIQTSENLAFAGVARARAARAAYLAALRACKTQYNSTHPNSTLTSTAALASDPNDIVGPTAFGDNRFVAADQPLDCTFDFQNQPTAGAPAQHIRISVPLDSGLDVRTFRLGAMTLGTTIIDPGTDTAFFQGQVDLTASLGVIVNIVAGVDVVTHEAFWDFQAIDPATGQPPTNPLVGLLPPDVSAPDGEGSVHYSILPLAGDVSGQMVTAQATIFFDNNSPIDTGIWSNTLDAVAPTSAVTGLQATTQTNSFKVSWAGSDDNAGSGVRSFNVYVSIDGGAFALWIANTPNTQGVYTGSTGHTYAFYSIALDNAGNEQGPKLLADARTQLVVTSIAGSIFNDANNDGIQDNGETGLSDWTVTLTPTGATPASPITTTTGDDGSYSFSGIAPGTYTVQETIQSGYARTAPLVHPAPMTVSNGQAAAGPVMGDVLISSVTLDFNYLVMLSRNYLKPGTFAQGDLSGDNFVDFTDLVLLSQNYLHPLPPGAAGVAPSAAAITKARSFATSLGLAVPPVMPPDPKTGSIRGTVFNDTNGDGKMQAAEKGLAGVRVFLDANHDGKLEAGEKYTLTDTSGNFTFAGLAAGTYEVATVAGVGRHTTTGVSLLTLKVGEKVTGVLRGQATNSTKKK